jgi:MoxR-like ATPase
MEENNLNEQISESTNLSPIGAETYVDVSAVIDFALRTRKEMQKVIIGMDETIDMIIVGLLTNGHILLEGVPGIAKTLLAKLVAKVLDVNYKRIQFTPDLMPSDVIGTTVYNMQSSKFYFRQGPVFSNIILADEINRSPAKTQAALFEVMEERQITVDGETHTLGYPLYVIATQNPIEQEGTYRLPEAQLDRFLFRLKIGYPSLEDESKILTRFKEDFFNNTEHMVNKLFNADDLLKCCSVVEKVHIKDEILNYIAQIVHNTRNNPNLFLGASPRASLAIMRTSKALAAMRGRDFVVPDDVQKVSVPVLNHRIILIPEKEIEGIDSTDIINDIIQKIEVPR